MKIGWRLDEDWMTIIEDYWRYFETTSLQGRSSKIAADIGAEKNRSEFIEEWGLWTPCSKSCGSSVKKRSRGIRTPKAVGNCQGNCQGNHQHDVDGVPFSRSVSATYGYLWYNQPASFKHIQIEFNLLCFDKVWHIQESSHGFEWFEIWKMLRLDMSRYR